jgi:hypothetical protein
VLAGHAFYLQFDCFHLSSQIHPTYIIIAHPDFFHKFISVARNEYNSGI